MADLPPLIEALCRPNAYPHPVAAVELHETHISWVLLAGDYAYKIKKPVDFGFLDFSTLARREHSCREELRLNRRLAPDLYLDVLPIAGSPAAPRMGGAGPVLEYAVQMHRFGQDALYDHLADAGRLDAALLDPLADVLAKFHGAVARSGPDGRLGAPECVHAYARQNFEQIRPRLEVADDLDRLAVLEDWTERAGARLAPRMTQRQAEGAVRECHGDLHLGNIVLWRGRPTPFDCIEFNPELRWIDVISELAFLLMDLEVRGLAGPAWGLLNRYLQRTGDYGGVALLDYYRVYRALVRAKIACLSAAPAVYRRYLDYALSVIRPRAPLLAITHGVSGSGKSHLAARLAGPLTAIWLRSDVERKRLAGLPAEATSGSAWGEGLYTQDSSARTYRRLLELAAMVLAAGHSVLVDATFLRRADRAAQHDLARRSGAGFLILSLQAPPSLLRQRVQERQRGGGDASEADLAVLQRQWAIREPLDAAEMDCTLHIDPGQALDAAAIARAIGSRFR